MPLLIAVCGIHEIDAFQSDLEPTHAVSLLDPDESWPRVDGVNAENHLTLPVHDISQPMPGFTHPQKAHIRALIDFGERMRPTIESDEARVLVHCFAGVSRSAAAAFALTCQLTNLTEIEALRSIQDHRPQMWPNELIVTLSDKLLGRRGRMVAALEAWRSQHLYTGRIL